MFFIISVLRLVTLCVVYASSSNTVTCLFSNSGDHIATNFSSGHLIGFMTSVCGAAGRPSVNHMFIINGAISPNAAHEVNPNTDSDGDFVSGIGPGSPVLYIMYSSTSGGCRSELEHRAIFVAAVMALSAPDASAPNCAECRAGFADGDSDPGTPCVHCQAGRFSSAVGATECEGALCSPGSYAAPGSTVASDCINCSAGLYDADTDPGTPCVECPSGTYADAAGSTECIGEGCWAGAYSPHGSTSATAAECIDCRPGYFDSDTNPSTLCEVCPAGRFSAAAGAIAECPGICLPGNYSAPASTSVSDCVTCAAGFLSELQVIRTTPKPKWKSHAVWTTDRPSNWSEIDGKPFPCKFSRG